MTCAAWLIFPINDFSVSVLIFVEANASFMSLVNAVFSLQVGIPSESECLCPNLGIRSEWAMWMWGPQRLHQWHRLDLQLWIKFLQHVTTKGVPINNIVFFKSPVTLCSDFCEYGIWGYRNNSLAWRWRIPAAWHGKIMLNLLEFLVSSVNIYMTILQVWQGSQILAFTNSSSALGWIHKASFDPVNAESHNPLARWLGWTLVSNETSLYSQHIKVT